MCLCVVHIYSQPYWIRLKIEGMGVTQHCKGQRQDSMLSEAILSMSACLEAQAKPDTSRVFKIACLETVR